MLSIVEILPYTRSRDTSGAAWRAAASWLTRTSPTRASLGELPTNQRRTEPTEVNMGEGGETIRPLCLPPITLCPSGSSVGIQNCVKVALHHRGFFRQRRDRSLLGNYRRDRSNMSSSGGPVSYISTTFEGFLSAFSHAALKNLLLSSATSA